MAFKAYNAAQNPKASGAPTSSPGGVDRTATATTTTTAAPGRSSGATQSLSLEGIDWKQFATMAAVGGMSGFVAGVFGIGGGTLTVPAIALTTDLTHHEILGALLMWVCACGGVAVVRVCARAHACVGIQGALLLLRV